MHKRFRFLSAIVILEIIGCFWSYPSLVRAMDYPVALDFGKVKPMEITTVTRMLPVSIALQKIDGIFVEMSSALAGSRQQTLPAKRLKLVCDGQVLPLSDSGLSLSLSPQSKTSTLLRLALLLELDPKDNPAQYRGALRIRPWVNRPGGQEWKNTITASLSVEVQPWLRMESAPEPLIIDTLSHSGLQIESVRPLELKIASNADWVLYCRRNSLNPATEITFKFKVNTDTPSLVRIAGNQNGWQNMRQDLAFGIPTTGTGGYWSTLTVSLQIDHFESYRSQSYSIPLEFGGEILKKDKTA